MGFEIRYTYHPRKEDGGYDTDVTDEKKVKVGKPFDDTPLEKCAAVIMGQLARRDVWVVDVSVDELVKKPISFKESKDGKGIVLKNKRFSLNNTAQLISEMEETEVVSTTTVQPHNKEVKHPHELLKPQKDSEASLYSGSGSTSGINVREVNQKRRLYDVVFDPGVKYAPMLKQMKVKLTEGKRYQVHETKRSEIAITNDAGQVMSIDEMHFSAAGVGLLGDAELGFSASVQDPNRAKLQYEDQMHTTHPEQVAQVATQVDADMTDIRPGKKF